MNQYSQHITCASLLGTLLKQLEFDVIVKGGIAASGNALPMTDC